MAIFDKISKTISTTTQNAARGAKEFADIARLNSLISGEEQQIASLYSQIGKLYFESAQRDPETPLGRLCVALAEAQKRIEKHNEDILQIKGTTRCPKCGNTIPATSAFCGLCGSSIEAERPQAEAPKTLCTGCGAPMQDGVAFCTACGKKN